MILRIIKWFWSWLRSIWYELIFIRRMFPTLKQIRTVATQNTEPGSWTIISFWSAAVIKNIQKPALIYGKRSFTFLQVEKTSNRYARMAQGAGIKAGQCVALDIGNSPELIFWFLGLAKIGAPVALINTSLSGAGLAHCLNSCNAEWLIYSREMKPNIESLSALDQSQRPKAIVKCMTELNGSVSAAAIPPGLRKNVRSSDTVLHVFTSGTEGLPKAAKISHLRYFGSSLIFSNMLSLRKKDVLYCPLPLYHSSAIVLGLGLCLHNGIPFVFQRKFSTTFFWDIVKKHNVTIVQYIGELCRYLTNAPVVTEETEHSIRIALGNGMQGDIWEKFQKRFQVKRIVEFYAASEANVGLVNLSGKVGAIGRLSPLLSRIYPGKLLRFDYETGQPYRNARGRCVECKAGEVGEFVGMINPHDPTQRFDGYSDESETEKKMLIDVLKKGDRCFRSGDLMKKDVDGYVFFVDRIGDTFRWKGENVSTAEVESSLHSCPGVKECSVYGVSIDGYEGKAGFAQIRVDWTQELPMADIEKALSKNLPEYARPVFMLFTENDIDTTTTFKYRKQEFASQGFQRDGLSQETHRLFVRTRDMGGTKFVEMTEDLKKGILDGSMLL